MTELGKPEQTMKLTVLYDNTSLQPELQADWGFACAIELAESKVLFDTGTDPQILLDNMEKLGFTPRDFAIVVISHDHYDHTGGLAEVLAANPQVTVVIPSRFSPDFKARVVGSGAKLIEIDGAEEIATGLYSSGQLGDGIFEQGVAMETADGLVVITGCAHPGVVEIVKQVKAALGQDIALVMGGFHLTATPLAGVDGIIRELKSLGAQRAAPCHCTGDAAIARFAQRYGNDFIRIGAGWEREFTARL